MGTNGFREDEFVSRKVKVGNQARFFGVGQPQKTFLQGRATGVVSSVLEVRGN